MSLLSEVLTAPDSLQMHFFNLVFKFRCTSFSGFRCHKTLSRWQKTKTFIKRQDVKHFQGAHTVVDGTNSCRNPDVHIIRMYMFDSSLFTHLPKGVKTSNIITLALFVNHTWKPFLLFNSQ